MPKHLPLAIALGLALSIGLTLDAVAHEGTGEAKIEAEPATLTAGDTVVLAGSGLEPDDDRVLVLVGDGLTVEFGTVTTDAEGMFSKDLTIPRHLPSGDYELRAIGDETLTTALAITAVTDGAEAAPPADAPDQTVVARDRSPLETGGILLIVLVAAAAGIFLVLRAERFRGDARV